MAPRAVEHADEQEATPGKALKRRGLIAGAAALIAGIAAKQASVPVAADPGGGDQGFLALGSNPWYVAGVSPPANAAATSSAPTVIQATPNFGNFVGTNSASPVLFAVNAGTNTTAGVSIDGIHGQAYGDGFGVYGAGGTGLYGNGNLYGVYGESFDNYAVYGHSTAGSGVSGHGGEYGVFGQTTAPSGSGLASGLAGVYGLGHGSGNFGVIGDGFGLNAGTGAVGVQGLGAQFGVVGTTNNAANTIAVWGNNTSTGANPIGVYGSTSRGTGVYGEAVNGIGVFGQTDSAGSYGVLGTTTVANSIALGGIANTDGSSAFSGGTANPNAYAAFFQGHVQVVSGAFDVFPMGNKHGLAPHPDGSHRTFYSVESPECWVEDFGEGTITAGKAEIKLDADFATLVHTDHYHVFLTAHHEHAMHVAQRTASGFTVAASAPLAKAAGVDVSQVSGTFSWRIVAKPKTTANVERLAKAIVGDPKVLIPDASKLPPRPAKSPPASPTPKPKS